MIYHGSKGLARKAGKFVLTGKGNDQYGAGAYFTADPKIASKYGKDIIKMDETKLRVVDGDSPMPPKLVTHLISKTPNKDWWTDWSESKREAYEMFRQTLNGRFVDDIQTLWYDLYHQDYMEFTKAVSKYVDAMRINDREYKNLYVVYNMSAINSIMMETFKEWLIRN